jgi:hypothetical protein
MNFQSNRVGATVFLVVLTSGVAYDLLPTHDRRKDYDLPAEQLVVIQLATPTTASFGTGTFLSGLPNIGQIKQYDLWRESLSKADRAV